MDLSNLTKRQVLIGGGAIAALYCILSLALFAGPVSNGVERAASDTLLIHGAEWADIEISGRDVIVIGEAPTVEAGQAAVEAVRAKWGVRVARAGFSIAPIQQESAGVTRSLQASGPPIEDAIECQSLLDGILSAGGVQFETGKAALADDASSMLDALGAALLQCARFKVSIDGHTDATGDAEANRKLSLVRAEAVVTYLTTKGVPNAQITAAGFGADMPIASNETESGRAQNRRIEFRVSQ